MSRRLLLLLLLVGAGGWFFFQNYRIEAWSIYGFTEERPYHRVPLVTCYR